jgi:hypothetical protein
MVGAILFVLFSEIAFSVQVVSYGSWNNPPESPLQGQKFYGHQLHYCLVYS